MLHIWLTFSCLVSLFHRPFAKSMKCTAVCNSKLPNGARTLCKKACEELLHVGKEKDLHNNTEKQDLLFNPSIPRLVSSRFRSIRLTWTNTSKHNLPVVRYILEIRPNWADDKGITIFPYIKKYRLTNDSDYTVKELLAKTGYKFRAAIVTLKTTSSFSEWSEIIRTNSTCDKKTCSVTNVRLKLTPSTSKENGPKLAGTFYWEPTTGLKSSEGSYYKIKSLSSEGLCNKQEYSKTGKVTELTSKNRSFHKFREKKNSLLEGKLLYFGCNYSVEIGSVIRSFPERKTEANWTWIFNIPKCFSSPKVCGCKREAPEREADIKYTKIHWTRTTQNTSSVTITWSDERWRKETNVTYFKIEIVNEISDTYSIYVNHKKNVNTYNVSFPNIKNEDGYSFSIFVFHGSNCVHVIEKLNFDVTYPCDVSNPCPGGNRTCLRNGYARKDGFKCVCVQGFDEYNNTCKERDKEPTRTLTTTNATIIILAVVPVIIFVAIAIIILIIRKKYQNNELPELNGDSNEYIKELNPLYTYERILYIFRELSDQKRFELPYENLRFDSPIGSGAFGEVYVGEAYKILEREGWTKVAIKMLPDSASSDEMGDFLAEIKLMMKVGQHENLIQMYCCCTMSPPICLIMEYASRGDLLSYLRSLKQKVYSSGYISVTESRKQAMGDARLGQESENSLNLRQFLSFSRQIVNGMTYLADREITHRDLAARNILLDENKVIKISDFGLSREGIYITSRNGRVPFRWLSIEAIQEGIYTMKSDVWAFGVVLWEMCTLGLKPYPSVSDVDLVDFLLSGERLEKTANCTNEIYDAMLKCWSTQPDDRPSFLELSQLLLKLENIYNEPMCVNTEHRTSSAPYNAYNQGVNNQNCVEQEIPILHSHIMADSEIETFRSDAQTMDNYEYKNLQEIRYSKCLHGSNANGDK